MLHRAKLADVETFLDGSISIEAFRDVSTNYPSETRALVGLIIASYWKIGGQPALERRPLGTLLQRVFPHGDGMVKCSTILVRSSRLGWHESRKPGIGARSRLRLPNEVKELLARHDDVPQGVAAFLQTQPPLD